MTLTTYNFTIAATISKNYGTTSIHPQDIDSMTLQGLENKLAIKVHDVGCRR